MAPAARSFLSKTPDLWAEDVSFPPPMHSPFMNTRGTCKYIWNPSLLNTVWMTFPNHFLQYRSSPCYLLHVILNFRTIPLAINFKHFHFLWWNIILVEYILSYQIRKSLIDHSCKILSTEQFVLTCSTKRAGPLRYHEYSILLYQGIDSCFDWRHDDAL